MSCLPPLPAGTDAQPVTVLGGVDLDTLLDDTPVNTDSTPKTLETEFIQLEPGSPKTTFISEAEKDVIKRKIPTYYDGITTPTGSASESSDEADTDTKLSRTPGNTSSDDNRKSELSSHARSQKFQKRRTTLAVLSSEDDSDSENIEWPTHSTKATLQRLQATALRRFKKKSKKKSKGLSPGEKKEIILHVKRKTTKMLVDLPKPPKKLMGDAYKIACENINQLL